MTTGRRRTRWTDAWTIERLSQLRSDLDSAFGRFMTECIRQTTVIPAEQQQEWLNRVELVEQAREWMLRDCDRWINECCQDQKR